MSNDSSICYDLGTLKPNEEKELDIYITVSQGSSIKEIETKIAEAKNIDVKKELDKAKKHWEKYVKEHDTIKLPESNTKYMKKLEKIYKRTILLYLFVYCHYFFVFFILIKYIFFYHRTHVF